MSGEQIILLIFILLFFGGLLAYFTFTTLYYISLLLFEQGIHVVVREPAVQTHPVRKLSGDSLAHKKDIPYID